MKLWQIFVAFFRVGIFGYGGGPGSIGLIKVEVVNNFRWMTEGEFAQALAIGNALPGPLATKLAAYVGYKTAGIAGAAVGLAAVSIPTAIAIIALFRIVLVYYNDPRMKGALRAVQPLVVMLLAQIVLGLGKKSFPNIWMAVIAAVSAVGLYYEVHPAILVAGVMAAGAIFKL